MADFDIYSTERGVCATHDAEEVAQYVRLAAGTIGASMVLYITTQLPRDRTDLKRMGYALGLACAGWNLFLWWRVREARGQ